MKNLPPTPVKTLEMARKVPLDTRFRFPYVGDVPGMKVKIPIVRTVKTS
jgi:pyruvate formate lyase activating enzyme